MTPASANADLRASFPRPGSDTCERRKGERSAEPHPRPNSKKAASEEAAFHNTHLEALDPQLLRRRRRMPAKSSAAAPNSIA